MKANDGRRDRESIDKKHFSQGSSTPEAAVVLAMILFLTAALVFLGFYLHDRLVLRSEALRCLSLALRNGPEPVKADGTLAEDRMWTYSGLIYGGTPTEDALEKLKNELEIRVKDRLLMSDLEGAELSMEGRELALRIRAVFRLRAGRIVMLLMNDAREMDTELSGRLRLKPEELVRLARGLSRE